MATDLLAGLSAPAQQLLAEVQALAATSGVVAYLVGGTVRDLLLHSATIDLDVVIVGAAIPFARALQQQVGGDTIAELRVHESFGTATLHFATGLGLDLITARHEQYPAPGALPLVTAGTLADDLQRRDFTINAMAVALQPPTGALLDPLGGRADLHAGVLRILHANSFLDDPTRILRGLRYAGRLAFHLAPDTAARCRAALAAGALATVSIQRFTHEFVRMLAEEQMVAIFDHAETYDLLTHLPVSLPWSAAVRQAQLRLPAYWAAIGEQESRYVLWEGRFALLTAEQPPALAAATAQTLQLPGSTVRLAEQVARLRALIATHPLPTANSQLGQLLDPFDRAAVSTVMALVTDESTVARLRHYLVRVRDCVPMLTGEALVALGLPPGPMYRQILQALLAYKRDHPAVTVSEEQAFLETWIAATRAQ